MPARRKKLPMGRGIFFPPAVYKTLRGYANRNRIVEEKKINVSNWYEKSEEEARCSQRGNFR